MFTYAADYKVIPGAYWQGRRAVGNPPPPFNLDWCGRNNQTYVDNPGSFYHPIETSVLRSYMGQTDRTFICPTGKRANLWFDYTMIIRFAGARIDLEWKVSYPETPSVATSPRVYFQAIPLLIEEDDRYYNIDFDDGSFANLDQFSRRHTRAGNIAYLDGSVSQFISPKGGRDNLEEPNDLRANHLRLHARNMMFPVWSSTTAEWGWVNRPR